MISQQLPRTAIIGAGSSGITALKTFAERGFDVTCFEASNRVGGNWVYENINGMSACYRDLHINTSRLRMAYSDYPMPDDYPDYPNHAQIAAYFDDYVDHFGVRDRIRFETPVEHAERLADGTWELTLGDGSSERFDALLVANGHHWNPRWPEPAFPGSESFEGEQMHAHSYMRPDSLDGKDVVVLGMGNSAMDISVEASYVAENVYLAARRGAYIVPKYIFGKPTDQLGGWVNPRIPFKIRQKAVAKLINTYVGKVTDFGLPKPDHEFGEAHPTVSSRILDRITHGAIKVKPNIRRLEGDEVEFEDGSRVHADVVIYCTGYKITFPFFDEDFISAPDNRIDLFRRVFKPDLPNLFFIGLLQPLGAVMPLSEAQGRWVADYLNGRYKLPPEGEMRSFIGEDMAKMQKRYVASKRHTIQVDFDDYLYELSKEVAAGEARAQAGGYQRPVETLAERDAAPA
jgi:cation diffusion facilitator CzcD-associated flavoprotein CzcO